MSASLAWDLQTAIYGALEAALAGQGESGADVPVFDHPPSTPALAGARFFVRLDGFSAQRAALKEGELAEHSFMVHVFDRPDGDEGGRGQKDVKRLSALVVGALNGVRPVASGSAIGWRSSFVSIDDDGVTVHGVNQFSVQLGG